MCTAVPGLLLIGAACTPWRDNLGLGLSTRRPLTAAVEATVAVVLVSDFVGLSASWVVVTFFPQTLDPSLSEAHRALTTGQRGLVSLRAGVQEETLDVILPAMTALAVIMVVRLLRRAPVRPTALAGRPWVWRACVLAATAGLFTRVLDHLYQGPVYAAAAAAWGLGFLIIFALHRSVWPLIAGHFLYDFVVVVLLPGHSVHRAVVVLVSGLAVLAVVRCLNHRRLVHPRPTAS